MKFGLRGVPVFVIGNDVIEGFDPNRIKSLLDYFLINCPSCKARMRVPKNKGKIKVTCSKCSEKFQLDTNK